MRRTRLTIAAALVAALVLSACGGTEAARVRAAAGDSRSASTTPAASADATPAAVAPVLVSHGDRKSQKVALTFDLCETPNSVAGYDAKIVDVLIGGATPATFMMGGHWATTHQAEAKKLGSITFFEIGNHTWAHRHETGISASAFDYEIDRAQEEIMRYAGVRPIVFRFPYGETAPKLLEQVAARGMTPIQWDVVTADPDKTVTAAAILATVKAKTQGGSIIIMHANGRGWHTAEALPKIVAYLKGEGYTLATVSELLADKP